MENPIIRLLVGKTRPVGTSEHGVRSVVALFVLVAGGCGGREEAAPIPGAPTPHGAERAASDGVIAGRVLTREGEGFAGIDLVAQSELSWTSTGTALSDESGVFRIEGLMEGPHTIRVCSARQDLASVEHVAAGTTGLVLTLAESARVNGRVLDPSGRPLDRFLVLVHADETDLFSGTVVSRSTIHRSADGRFELGGLPEGVHVVETRAEGFAPSFSEPFRTVRDATTRDVVVRMTEGGSLAGLVLDAGSGLPIAGAEVFPLERYWLSVRTGAGSERVRVFQWNVPLPLTRMVVRTDPSGRFRFAHMAPGQHRLRIQAKGYAFLVTDEVRVEEQVVTELPPQSVIVGATITGIVRGLKGKIEPGAHVQLAPAGSDPCSDHRSVRADATGRFTLANVAPSTYRLSATRAQPSDDPFEAIGDIRRSEIEISVADGGRHELDLDLGTELR